MLLRSFSACRKALAAAAVFATAVESAAGVDVLTVHYDNSRTGTNLAETVLNQGDVNVSSFGRLYTRTIDAYTYAQPLYVAGVTIGGASRDVVYVATEHNSVYAFDADDATGDIPAYWTVNLGPSVPYLDVYTNGDTNITPEVGITGTPVIDKASGTLYVVAFTKEAGPSYHQRLHALDLATGAEKFGGPVEIAYSQTIGGHLLTFNPKRQNQRPGLALANGSVYIAWASFGDIGLNEAPETAYNGYVMRYSATTLQQQAVFVAAPGGSGAGIWQVGCGPAVDAAGNVYVVTGNGTSDTDAGGNDYGETALKLSPSLAVSDWFTPYNKDYLNSVDADLGAAGHVLVDVPSAPVHKHLMIHGSKEGKLYVLDRDSMGHFHAGDDSNAVQVVRPGNDEIRSTPVYWQGPAGGRIFANGQGSGGLYAVGVNADGTVTNTSVATAHLLDSSTFRGSHMTLSSNGAVAGSGVIWTFSPTIGDPVHAVGPGILRAFNAETLQELYNSQLNPARDSIGNYPKYVPPTVANGRVYVPTFSGKLHVFGQLASNPSLTVAITSPATGASFAEPANITIGANASAGAVGIAKVGFYNGTSLIAEDTTAPYSVSWSSVTAGTYTLQAIATDSNGASATSAAVTITVTGSGGTGTILHQVWSNIGPGVSVSDLTSAPGFPDNPTTQDQLSSFEGPTDVADNYGSRIAGYVIPPISGSYTFWIAGDDSCELWLSSDDNPVHKARIAYVNGWTTSREWGKYPSQQSAPLALVGGQRYYVEALHKEGGGGDNLAVGWQLPNAQLERPILGSHLAPAAPAGSTYGMASRGSLASLPLPSNLSSPPPTTLSATGVFSSLATLAPSSGIVPYTPNTPLWSDAAVKNRWIALPNTARIGFAATGEWTFPGGTVFIKHFELGTDDANPSARKRLETRLLVLDNTGANGYGITYKWRADNSDADLVQAAGLDENVTIANAGGGTRVQTWHYPSQTECLQCHTVNSGFVLGAKTRQLNGTITYPASGVADNQLRTWNHLGMFTTDIGEGAIAGMSRMVAVNDSAATLENRVKSYLDANCGQCHRPGGIAGWDARYDTAMTAQGIIGATPIHGDLGVTGAKIVAPGDTASSVLRLRMASLATGTKMPPLARNLVDAGALGVVDQWINGLSSAVANGTGLTAQYWTSQTGTFSGPPTLTRTDSTVDFQWLNGSPDPSISVDHFTARWTGQIQAQGSETYTFWVTGDDGIRLWVNGQLLIDGWVDQPPTEYSAAIALAAGQKYDLRLEYYENGGGAMVKLAWSSPTIAKQTVPRSQLYPAQTTNLAPVVNAGADLAITLPASASLAGSAGDDGVPGPLTVAWSLVSGPGTVAFADPAAAATTASFSAAGTYTLRLSASDGALTSSDDVAVTVAPAAAAAFTGIYYDNIDFTGPSLTRLDPTIDFAWYLGSPDPSIGVDTFSVRWTGTVVPQASETYTFYTSTDDGVRLWVNGQLIVDKWIDQGLTTWTGSIALTAGQAANIQMDFYENGGQAMAKLEWSSPSTPRQVVQPGSQQPTNLAPVVNAGSDLAITLPASASLAGSASDDGRPGPLTVAWSTVSGPGTVAFANPAAATTTASFSAAGTYTLRLSASDGALTSSDDVVVTVAPAAASGFTGVYYDNIDFTGPSLTRLDPTIDFAWYLGSPDPSIGVDTFSVRWTGTAVPQASETYTFYTSTDDGVRLWVNGQLIVDKWIDQGLTTWTGTIALTAGQAANIQMDFYENGGQAMAKLEWSSPSTPRQVVQAGAASSPPPPASPPPSGLFSANINFQPAAAPPYPGWLVDSSQVYGDRGNGFTYGWNAAFDETRDRDAPASPDQRYDTFDHMQKPSNPNAMWEIAVPNGTYQVRIVSGDANFTDSVFKIAVEGVLVVDGVPADTPASAHWVDSGYRTVTVADGRLSVTSAAGSSNNKICFIEIQQQPTGTASLDPVEHPTGALATTP
jgi:uncharacterized repeat protein (TIGR03806 family)